MALAALTLTACTASAPKPSEADAAAPQDTAVAATPIVYFTSQITPEALVRIYDALGVKAHGRVAGKISAVSMAYTTLITPENKQIFIPNSQMASTKIINYSALGKRRIDLKFTASYDAPVVRVRAAIEEAISTLPAVLDDPAPVVYVSEYQASSIEYLALVWVPSGGYLSTRYAMIEAVRESFNQFGVEMTYDHLNVHIVEK